MFLRACFELLRVYMCTCVLVRAHVRARGVFFFLRINQLTTSMCVCCD